MDCLEAEVAGAVSFEEAKLFSFLILDLIVTHRRIILCCDLYFCTWLLFSTWTLIDVYGHEVFLAFAEVIPWTSSLKAQVSFVTNFVSGLMIILELKLYLRGHLLTDQLVNMCPVVTEVG